MRSFRAGTLNIWSRFGPWDERLVALRAGLREVDPDILGMQEVLNHDGFDQAALVSEGRYYIAWGRSSENHGFPTGNAILSRWPITRTEVVELPNGGSDEHRSVVFAECDSPYGKLPVFCTHLNWKLHHGHIRVLQVKALVEAVDRIAPVGSGFPAIVMGDFNAEPDADEIRYLRGPTALGGPCVYFCDAFGTAGDGTPGATFSKNNPFAEPIREPERRIDYVFVRGPDDSQRGEPRDARVCFDKAYEGTFPTDHFGVVTTITAGR